MILLLLIFWFLLYHGFVLWLALRFKTKPWRWYWFGAVITIGLTVAWFDQFYIRYVVIGHYCEKDKDQLGFHEYEPAVVKADKVTWLWQWSETGPPYSGPPRTHSGIQKKEFEQDGFYVKTDNVMTCKKENGDLFACLVDGYLEVEKYKPLDILSWHFAGHTISQLVREDAVVREVSSYEWWGSAFFRFFPGLNIPIFYDQEICGMSQNEINSIGSPYNFRIKVVE